MSNPPSEEPHLSTGPLLHIYDQLGLAKTVDQIREKTIEGMELYKRALQQETSVGDTPTQFQFLRFIARYLVTQSKGKHGLLDGVPELFRHTPEQTKNDVYEPVEENNKEHLSFLNDYVIKIYPDLDVLRVLGDISDKIAADPQISAAPFVGVWKDEHLAVAPIKRIKTHTYAEIFKELKGIMTQDPKSPNYNPEDALLAQKVKDKVIKTMLEREAYTEVELPKLHKGVSAKLIMFEENLNELFKETQDYTDIELTPRQEGLLGKIAQKLGEKLDNCERRTVSRDPSPQHYFTTINTSTSISDLVRDLMELASDETKESNSRMSGILDGKQIDWDRIIYATIEPEVLCHILEYKGIELAPLDAQRYELYFLHLKQELEGREITQNQLDQYNNLRPAASFYRSFRSAVNRTNRQLRLNVKDQRKKAIALKPLLTQESQKRIDDEVWKGITAPISGLEFRGDPEEGKELLMEYLASKERRLEREIIIRYYHTRAQDVLEEGIITQDERAVLDKFINPEINNKKLKRRAKK